MRPGHNSSRRLEEGVQAHPEIEVVLVAAAKGQLIDEDGPQRELLARDQPLVGTAPCTSKMALNWPLKFSFTISRIPYGRTANDISEMKLRAERKLGEMLRKQARGKAQRDQFEPTLIHSPAADGMHQSSP